MLSQRVSEPSEMSDSRSSHSIHASSWGAQGEVVRSGGDQHGEWVLKSLPMMRGPAWRGRLVR